MLSISAGCIECDRYGTVFFTFLRLFDSLASATTPVASTCAIK